MARRRRTLLLAPVAVLLAVLAAGAAGAAHDATTPARWIVFSAHPAGAPQPIQLMRVRTDGTGLRQITTGRLPATEPAFSPDGRQLAFARLGSGIFRVAPDGSGLKRLTSGARDIYPVWSPDGKRIAFLRPFRAEWRLYTMTAAGTSERRLPAAPSAGRPSWTPNGKSILIPSAADLLQVDAVTGRVQRYFGLTIDLDGSQTATVSPDAKSIAYVGPRLSTGPEDCGEGPCPQFALYLARVPAPHRPRRVDNDAGPGGWSPDGRTVVYVHRGALALRTVSTGALRSVATKPHVPAGDSPPAWQPR